MKTDALGQSVTWCATYVKRDGSISQIEGARLIRYHQDSESVTVKTPSGVRTLRLWGFVAFNGEAVGWQG